jgi:hypothetical protein
MPSTIGRISAWALAKTVPTARRLRATSRVTAEVTSTLCTRSGVVLAAGGSPPHAAQVIDRAMAVQRSRTRFGTAVIERRCDRCAGGVPERRQPGGAPLPGTIARGFTRAMRAGRSWARSSALDRDRR